MKTFACTVGAILVAITSAAPAAAIDITFDDVTSVGNPIVTLLDEHGYRFTGAFRTIDTPGGTFVSNGSAVYLAQPAGLPGITILLVGGGPFVLYEFDAAGLLTAPAGGAPNAQQVSLVGLQVGGAMLNGSFTLGPGFTHFAVPTTWSDLQFVTLSGLTTSGVSAVSRSTTSAWEPGPTPRCPSPARCCSS